VLAAWIRFTDYSVGVFLISIDELACSDAIDNDGDGLVDYGEDTQCGASWWDREQPACGLGAELALAALAALRRRCSSAAESTRCSRPSRLPE
jgi:hypothetical protein